MTQAVMTVAVIAARLGDEEVVSPLRPRTFAPIAAQRPAPGPALTAMKQGL